MSFQLPGLPYAYDALNPYIDPMTMEIHHSKHHAAYTNNLNAALEGSGNENKDIETLLAEVSKHPVAVRNNGGGFYNHDLFWQILSPKGGGQAAGELQTAIDKAFGSFKAFQDEFSKAAATRFGSGWAWLLVNNGVLKVSSTPNQDNPLMDVTELKGTPILGLDVWEHAYYLKYQNRRPEYIEAFWNIVNWEEVLRRFEDANK